MFGTLVDWHGSIAREVHGQLAARGFAVDGAAFATAWRDLPGLREPDRFDAWLQRVVVRECIDQATRERDAFRKTRGAK